MLLTILIFLLLCLGYLLLALLLLVLLLLALVILIPYTYELRGGNIGQRLIQGQVSWLFGGFQFSFLKQGKQKIVIAPVIFGFPLKSRISPAPAGSGLPTEDSQHKDIIEKSDTDEKKNTGKTKKEKKAGRKPKVKKGRQSFPVRLYLKKSVLRTAFSFISRVIKFCLPQKFSAEARVGFADPMYTGLLSAWSTQTWLLPGNLDLHLQPVFDEEIYEGRFLIGGKLWLAHLIALFLGFLTARPIRNILLAHLKLKIKGGNHYGG
jgi:hypothetical protein